MEADQQELPLAYECSHPRQTEPRNIGGNYGYYGWRRCLVCGATRDDYSYWRKPLTPLAATQ